MRGAVETKGSNHGPGADHETHLQVDGVKGLDFYVAEIHQG
jgi:hypothetical protein